jgi:hypothetical protein
MMFRINLALFVLIGAYVAWWLRQRRARQRLREIDEGRRCVACDGTQLAADGSFARCLRCGHVASLSALRAAKVSESEIADVTKPDDRRL